MMDRLIDWGFLLCGVALVVIGSVTAASSIWWAGILPIVAGLGVIYLTLTSVDWR